MYTVHELADQWLVDNDGRRTGNVSRWVVSRHRTLELAAKRIYEIVQDGTNPASRAKFEIRDSKTGEVVYAAWTPWDGLERYADADEYQAHKG